MKTLGLCLLLLVVPSLPALAGDASRLERVQFKPGTEGATVKGRLAGREDVDYLLRAQGGQRMRVALHTDHTQLYFNILPPGGPSGDEAALFIGSTAGNRFDDDLPRGGDYRIRVYLMRAAARRDETASYRLDIRIEDTPVSGPDFADGLAGGPDFWAVTGLGRGDTLKVRAGPSAEARVVDTLDEGEVLRNLGCRLTDGQRWCRVARPHDSRAEVWVAGRYLRESSEQP